MHKTATDKAAMRLHQAGIHATTIRLMILNAMEQAQEPLSAKEIEERLGAETDRVTVYRTLKLFVEKGLTHRIEVSESLTAYRLSIDNNVEHPHFHCIDCNRVFCMPQLPVTRIELPEGFATIRNRQVVDGTCKNCNLQNK